jgi:hypothetical protein
MEVSPKMPRSSAPKSKVAVTPAAKVIEPAQWIDERATEKATRAARARHASGRRRHIDPTTCERDYSQDEIEFMNAMNLYKKSSGRAFPTWSEVLEVLRSLGYEKQAFLKQFAPDQDDPSSV